MKLNSDTNFCKLGENATNTKKRGFWGFVWFLAKPGKPCFPRGISPREFSRAARNSRNRKSGFPVESGKNRVFADLALYPLGTGFRWVTVGLNRVICGILGDCTRYVMWLHHINYETIVVSWFSSYKNHNNHKIRYTHHDFYDFDYHKIKIVSMNWNSWVYVIALHALPIQPLWYTYPRGFSYIIT